MPAPFLPSCSHRDEAPHASTTESDGEITAAKAAGRDLEATPEKALSAATHCQQAYLTAPDSLKRQINQGFFNKLFIDDDGQVEIAELTEPFTALLDPDDANLADIATSTAETDADDTATSTGTIPPVHPSDVFTVTWGDIQ